MLDLYWVIGSCNIYNEIISAINLGLELPKRNVCNCKIIMFMALKSDKMSVHCLGIEDNT